MSPRRLSRSTAPPMPTSPASHSTVVQIGGDPAPCMPPVISRIRSLYAPGWGGLQKLLV